MKTPKSIASKNPKGPLFPPHHRARGTAPEPSERPKPSAEASKVLQRPSPARPVILQKPTHLGPGERKKTGWWLKKNPSEK